MASAIVGGGCFGDLPILADALEECGCTCAAALACFRKGEKSATVDYLLDLILGRLPPPTVVDSRPMTKLAWNRNQPNPKAFMVFPEETGPTRELHGSLRHMIRRMVRQGRSRKEIADTALRHLRELLRQGHSPEAIGKRLEVDPEIIRCIAEMLRGSQHLASTAAPPEPPPVP